MRYTKITPIQLKRKNSLIFYSSVYFHALSGIGGLKLEKLTIGKLIEYQMNKKGIDMEKLVEGLCSITSLKRLIQGDTIQSFFLMERIIERLGLSVNKISLLHNEKEDELFIRRGIIGKLLTKGDYDRVGKLLSNYKEAADLSNTLQLQYVYEVEGIIATKRDGNAKEALQLFCKAFGLHGEYVCGKKYSSLSLGRRRTDFGSSYPERNHTRKKRRHQQIWGKPVKLCG